MKSILSIFYLFIATAVLAMFLRGINNLMVDYDIRYFWEIISTGFAIYLVASLLALKKGFKIKSKFNPAILFANTMFRTFGLPILTVIFVTPQELAAVPHDFLQVAFPLVSIIGLWLSYVGMYEQKEPQRI